MSLSFALLIVLELLVKICNGKTSIELFTSNDCEEDSLRISADDTYHLIWYGQITPKLCSFTFKRYWNTNKICFQSEVYDLHYSIGDVKVRITNNTKSTWEYDSYVDKIQHKCVEKAYNLNISILVPSGYKEPNSKKYIELIIAGDDITDAKDDSNDLPESIILFVISGIVFIVLLFCCSSKGKECRDNSEGIRELPQCCLEVVCACIKCKCLRGCESPSCNCQLQDICKPVILCGECCSAWAGCCATLIVRARQGDTNQTSNTRTEVHGIPDDSESIQVSRTGIAVTSSASESTVLPPSYDIATGMVTIDPTIPPPSYEEVTAQTSPSAPPWSQ